MYYRHIRHQECASTSDIVCFFYAITILIHVFTLACSIDINANNINHLPVGGIAIECKSNLEG
jgi:hypothetical protein